MSWVTSTTANTSGIGGVDARSFMDGSGWTISTGSAKAVGGARTQTGSPFDAVATPVDSASLAPLAIAAAVVLVLVLALKKRA